MSNIIKIFENELFGNIRTIIGVDDKPLFVMKDVCTILGISKYRDSFMNLPEYCKGCPVSMDTPGGPQLMQAINEPGIYYLTIHSHKPIAQEFAKWVYTEVLPSIREHGAYISRTELDNVRHNAAIMGSMIMELKDAEVANQLGVQLTKVLNIVHDMDNKIINQYKKGMI